LTLIIPLFCLKICAISSKIFIILFFQRSIYWISLVESFKKEGKTRWHRTTSLLKYRGFLFKTLILNFVELILLHHRPLKIISFTSDFCICKDSDVMFKGEMLPILNHR